MNCIIYYVILGQVVLLTNDQKINLKKSFQRLNSKFKLFDQFNSSVFISISLTNSKLQSQHQNIDSSDPQNIQLNLSKHQSKVVTINLNIFTKTDNISDNSDRDYPENRIIQTQKSKYLDNLAQSRAKQMKTNEKQTVSNIQIDNTHNQQKDSQIKTQNIQNLDNQDSRIQDQLQQIIQMQRSQQIEIKTMKEQFQSVIQQKDQEIRELKDIIVNIKQKQDLDCDLHTQITSTVQHQPLVASNEELNVLQSSSSSSKKQKAIVLTNGNQEVQKQALAKNNTQQAIILDDRAVISQKRPTLKIDTQDVHEPSCSSTSATKKKAIVLSGDDKPSSKTEISNVQQNQHPIGFVQSQSNKVEFQRDQTTIENQKAQSLTDLQKQQDIQNQQNHEQFKLSCKQAIVLEDVNKKDRFKESKNEISKAEFNQPQVMVKSEFAQSGSDKIEKALQQKEQTERHTDSRPKAIVISQENQVENNLNMINQNQNQQNRQENYRINFDGKKQNTMVLDEQSASSYSNSQNEQNQQKREQQHRSDYSNSYQNYQNDGQRRNQNVREIPQLVNVRQQHNNRKSYSQRSSSNYSSSDKNISYNGQTITQNENNEMQNKQYEPQLQPQQNNDKDQDFASNDGDDLASCTIAQQIKMGQPHSNDNKQNVAQVTENTIDDLLNCVMNQDINVFQENDQDNVQKQNNQQEIVVEQVKNMENNTTNDMVDDLLNCVMNQDLLIPDAKQSSNQFEPKVSTNDQSAQFALITMNSEALKRQQILNQQTSNQSLKSQQQQPNVSKQKEIFSYSALLNCTIGQDTDAANE